MASPILVTGGTGTLGGHVLPLLRDADRDLRVLSRKSRPSADGIEYLIGDLLKNEGIEAAVDGVETVLHMAGGAKGDDEATRNLVRAAAKARVRHLVHISVIGADRVPLAWFKAQVGAEQAVTGSGIPWTMMRAAQFHDLVFNTVEKMAKLPVVPLPGGLRFQPVDSRDVAERLVGLTLDEPAGLVSDLAGPQVYTIGDLIRGYLSARGKRRPMMPIRMPGKAGRAYRAGENLTLEGATKGNRTWEDFLSEKTGSQSGSKSAVA
jgi:uncharacterized protein YbjT (DUF2867 family)